MEVLLLEDIPGIGYKNDIIVVKNGFAMNNLLPRRRALVATPTVRRRYAEQIRRRAEEKQREIDLARSAAGVLKDAALRFARKATKNNKLYAAISEKDISEALSEQFGVEVAEADVATADQIKSIGMHTAKIKLCNEEEIEIKIKVEAEE